MSENKKINIKEIIKEEYVKCSVDPIYFIKKYCKIQHPTKGKILFDLYPFQENVLAAFLKYDRVVILKNRQMGISTLAAAYALWLMTFFEDKNILVIATKQHVAKNLIDKVRIMHAGLPVWLKQRCIEYNKLALKYINGSRIYASTSASDSGRSEAVSLLIIDEAAFIPRMEELWGALQPTLSTGGNVIVLSTPNGVGNWYHEIFIKAEEGKNNFYPITLHWSMHPEKTIEWRQQQDIELGPRLAKQECDGTFLSSGDTVIDGEILEWYRQNYISDPIEKTGVDRNIWIWKYPSLDKKYILSADVSRGDSSDYSTFHILELDTLEQVVEYQGKIDTKQFADLCVEYATKYNDAVLVADNSNIGWAVIQRIIDREYKNLFYTDLNQEFIDKRTVEDYVGNYRKYNRKSVPGFSITSKTRPLIISKMEQYFNERSIIIHSKRLLNELYTFIWNSGRPEPSSNRYHDDLILAYAVGLWVRDVAIKLKEYSLELHKASLSAFRVERSEPAYNYYGALYLSGKGNTKMRIGNEEIDLIKLI